MRYFLIIVRGIFLEGLPLRLVVRQSVADGGDRRGDADRRRLAVPPSGVMRGLEIFCARTKRQMYCACASPSARAISGAVQRAVNSRKGSPLRVVRSRR